MIKASKEDIQRLYVVEKLSLRKVAKLLQINIKTVINLMDDFGIKRRTLSEVWGYRVVTEATKNKMSMSAKGKPKHFTPEQLENLRLRMIGKRYALGRHHTLEEKIKIGKGNIGKIITEESKQKMRLSHLGKKLSLETRIKLSGRKGNKSPSYGKHPSKETLIRMSIGRKGIYPSDETKNKLKLLKANPEYRAKLSSKMKTMWLNMKQEDKDVILQKQKVAVNKPEYKLKRRDITINLWKNSDYKDKNVREIMKGWHIRPNKPETFIQSVLDKMYPGEYEYTGDGQRIVGGKCPDFYNSQKHKIILFHGIYWHLTKFQSTNPNLTKEQVENKDISHYRKYGYDILIIWEDEMADTNAMLSKIASFHNKVVIGEKPIAICEAEIASGVLPKNGGEK